MLELEFDEVVTDKKEIETQGFKIYDCEQNSSEWYECRLRKITASNMKTLMGNGITRDNILLSKASEIITGVYDESERFTNKDIKRGNDLEIFAKEKYEELNNINVRTVGFVELDKFVGVSPDGLVGDDGLIEIKCPNNKNYIKQVIHGKESISNIYITQMQMQMYVTNRKWCDYVIYNQDFIENDITVFRIGRDEEHIEEIKAEIERAKKDICRMVVKFKANKQLNN